MAFNSKINRCVGREAVELAATGLPGTLVRLVAL